MQDISIDLITKVVFILPEEKLKNISEVLIFYSFLICYKTLKIIEDFTLHLICFSLLIEVKAMLQTILFIIKIYGKSQSNRKEFNINIT